MNSDKKEYDLACSLGGSCASAHNLFYRKMRYVSLPFDWLFLVEQKTIEKLIECFNNDFSNFLLKENLEELKGEERGNAGKYYQYKDKATGYRFIHFFDKPITNENSYKKVKEKFDKRIQRLYSLIEKSESILFLLDIKFPIDLDLIKRLENTLIEKFGNKKMDFVILEFNSTDDDIYLKDNVTVYKIKREINLYDFNETNFEWAFLDNIKISKNLFKPTLQIISIKKIKKGYGIYILNQIPSILRIRLYIIGIRFDFCLGRVRE